MTLKLQKSLTPVETSINSYVCVQKQLCLNDLPKVISLSLLSALVIGLLHVTCRDHKPIRVYAGGLRVITTFSD